MTRHGPPTFALVAALLVVVAGMVVMFPAAGAAPADVSPYAGADGDHLPGGATASPGSTPGQTSVVDRQGLYEELSTYVSTGSGPSVTRQVEGDSEDDSDPEQRLHRWRCPICDATKLSFGATDVDPGEAAANNLRSHIRNSDGGGHGPLGTVPGRLTARDIVDSVAVMALAD